MGKKAGRKKIGMALKGREKKKKRIAQIPNTPILCTEGKIV